MTHYLDTSLLVATLTRESLTAEAQNWLAAQALETFVISDWVLTEFSSALALKLRSKQIDAAYRAAVLTQFGRFVEDSLTVAPVSRSHFRTAALFTDQHRLGLRSGNALHLAVCAGLGATMCTLDRGMAEAGASLGVATVLIGPTTARP